MPYQNEFARKTTHFDFVRNPEVQEFLANCEYLTPPNEKEAQALTSVFQKPPRSPEVELPNLILATDGSYHESAIDDRIPTTRVGYIKIGAVLFSLQEFADLREGRFVDPFKVAALQDNNTALTFVLPSANVRLPPHNSVRDSFRAALDQQLLSEKTRFNPKNFHTSLRSLSLIHI